MDRKTEEQVGGVISSMTYRIEQKAWENISVLDDEFDEWEYGQEVEQRYWSPRKSYNNHIPTGKSPDEYEKGRS